MLLAADMNHMRQVNAEVLSAIRLPIQYSVHAENASELMFTVTNQQIKVFHWTAPKQLDQTERV